MRKGYLFMLILLAFTKKLDAQTQKQNTQDNLTIGDSLPSFQIGKLINSDKTKINTEDFKQQLLIIDFWATNCSGCVEALPKMERLQKDFGSKIKILPVTEEPEALVSTFWKNNSNTKDLIISSVVEDKIFSSIFKHIGMPHEVWVYRGKVIAITGPDYVDANNIRKVLAGQEIKWPVKYDFYAYDGTKQYLFQPDDNQIDTNSTRLNYAAISDYKEGVNSIGLTGGSGIVRNLKQKTIRAFFLNQPIYTSYLLNWTKIIKAGTLVKPTEYGIAPNEIVWEVEDRSKYIYNPKSAYLAEWIRKNGICFEALYTDTGQGNKEVYKSMIEDLDRLLGLKVRWEKRKEKVLTLKFANVGHKLKSSKINNGTKNGTIEKNGLIQFRNMPLSSLTYRLNQEAENPYVFDETNYKENIDLDLQISSWTDISGIRKAISTYGLELKEEERFVDCFVFTEY